MTKPATKTPTSGSPALKLMALRQWHLYLGALFAPSILFFAATGALQLFGLHHASPDGGYTPPPIVKALAKVHKDQVFELKAKPKPDAAAAGPAAGEEDHDRGHGRHHDDGDNPAPKAKPAWSMKTAALKFFLLFTAVGLITTTALGLWMGLKYSRSPKTAWILLAVGTAIPILLLAI